MVDHMDTATRARDDPTPAAWLALARLLDGADSDALETVRSVLPWLASDPKSAHLQVAERAAGAEPLAESTLQLAVALTRAAESGAEGDRAEQVARSIEASAAAVTLDPQSARAVRFLGHGLQLTLEHGLPEPVDVDLPFELPADTRAAMAVCYARAVQVDRTSAAAWHFLGQALASARSQAVELARAHVHDLPGPPGVAAASCFARAVALEPEEAPYWINLGWGIAAGLQGTSPAGVLPAVRAVLRELPKRPIAVLTWCAARGVSLNPSPGMAWANLALRLHESEKESAAEECYGIGARLAGIPADHVRALLLCASRGSGVDTAWLWETFGFAIERTIGTAAEQEAVQIFDGPQKPANARSAVILCFARTVAKAPSVARYWLNLAHGMIRSIADRDGEPCAPMCWSAVPELPASIRLAAVVAASRATEIGSESAEWHALGTTIMLAVEAGQSDVLAHIPALLPPSATDLSGALMCMARAIRLMPTSANSWSNLTTYLTHACAVSAPSTELGLARDELPQLPPTFGAAALFSGVRSLELEPRRAAAWCNLREALFTIRKRGLAVGMPPAAARAGLPSDVLLAATTCAAMAATLAPSDPTTWGRLAEVLLVAIMRRRPDAMRAAHARLPGLARPLTCAAVEAAARHYSLAPGSPATWQLLGTALMFAVLEGGSEPARALADRHVDGLPEDVFDAAAHCLSRELAVTPTDANSWINLATVLVMANQRGRLESASVVSSILADVPARSYELAVHCGAMGARLLPDSGLAWVVLGQSLFVCLVESRSTAQATARDLVDDLPGDICDTAYCYARALACGDPDGWGGLARWCIWVRRWRPFPPAAPSMIATISGETLPDSPLRLTAVILARAVRSGDIPPDILRCLDGLLVGAGVGLAAPVARALGVGPAESEPAVRSALRLQPTAAAPTHPTGTGWLVDGITGNHLYLRHFVQAAALLAASDVPQAAGTETGRFVCHTLGPRGAAVPVPLAEIDPDADVLAFVFMVWTRHLAVTADPRTLDTVLSCARGLLAHGRGLPVFVGLDASAWKAIVEAQGRGYAALYLSHLLGRALDSLASVAGVKAELLGDPGEKSLQELMRFVALTRMACRDPSTLAAALQHLPAALDVGVRSRKRSLLGRFATVDPQQEREAAILLIGFAHVASWPAEHRREAARMLTERVSTPDQVVLGPLLARVARTLEDDAWDEARMLARIGAAAVALGQALATDDHPVDRIAELTADVSLCEALDQASPELIDGWQELLRSARAAVSTAFPPPCAGEPWFERLPERVRDAVSTAYALRDRALDDNHWPAALQLCMAVELLLGHVLEPVVKQARRLRQRQSDWMTDHRDAPTAEGAAARLVFFAGGGSATLGQLIHVLEALPEVRRLTHAPGSRLAAAIDRVSDAAVGAGEDRELLDRLEWIRTLRNRSAHGLPSVPPAQLELLEHLLVEEPERLLDRLAS